MCGVALRAIKTQLCWWRCYQPVKPLHQCFTKSLLCHTFPNTSPFTSRCCGTSNDPNIAPIHSWSTWPRWSTPKTQPISQTCGNAIILEHETSLSPSARTISAWDWCFIPCWRLSKISTNLSWNLSPWSTWLSATCQHHCISVDWDGHNRKQSKDQREYQDRIVQDVWDAAFQSQVRAHAVGKNGATDVPDLQALLLLRLRALWVQEVICSCCTSRSCKTASVCTILG